MAHPKDGSVTLRPRTAVLTRGFDPSLSFGSARPAVFRSSTYVFATPEAAERAFAIAQGRIAPEEGERARSEERRVGREWRAGGWASHAERQSENETERV